jgi:TPR repeat protein
LSVPINDFVIANEELASMGTEMYYECCGKSICRGCLYSFQESGNGQKKNCPYCKVIRISKTKEEGVQDLMKRVEANDAGATFALGNCYYIGQLGLSQDREKSTELWTQAAELGSNRAHFHLGVIYNEGGALKKAKFHYEAAAVAGHEVARNNLGTMEAQSGNMEQAVKHWKIAASAGDHKAMYNLLIHFKQGSVSREVIDSTLEAYNNACAKMRSEARDTSLNMYIDSIGGM